VYGKHPVTKEAITKDRQDLGPSASVAIRPTALATTTTGRTKATRRRGGKASS
jgi:hypothetical protein